MLLNAMLQLLQAMIGAGMVLVFGGLGLIVLLLRLVEALIGDYTPEERRLRIIRRLVTLVVVAALFAFWLNRLNSAPARYLN